LEQALDDKSALTLSYVGNHGIHIPIINGGPNSYDAAGTAGLPTSAMDPRFATVSYLYTGAVSNYNGLTATYTRRFTAGFTINANYTWSHAMDEVSNGGINVYGNDSLEGQLNPFNLRDNYGNADNDIRHYFSATYVWQLPFKFTTGWVNQTLGGWTISQNFFARSGLPYTVVDGNTALANYALVNPVAQ
jgi:hypothetical protein